MIACGEHDYEGVEAPTHECANCWYAWEQYLENQLEELRPAVEEAEQLQAALELHNDINYLVAEGFIEVEEGEDGQLHLYHVGEPCTLL
jgi:hypothetical protein